MSQLSENERKIIEEALRKSGSLAVWLESNRVSV